MGDGNERANYRRNLEYVYEKPKFLQEMTRAIEGPQGLQETALSRRQRPEFDDEQPIMVDSDGIPLPENTFARADDLEALVSSVADDIWEEEPDDVFSRGQTQTQTLEKDEEIANSEEIIKIAEDEMSKLPARHLFKRPKTQNTLRSSALAGKKDSRLLSFDQEE